LYLLAQISTRKYAPLTFPPLRVGRDDYDDISAIPTTAKNTVTTVIIVTLFSPKALV
jgi:hypothetical protein